jgi:CheY-like chemotaxis protein/HPt (histidine-containing phosphotransfer) domain-containing protein
LLGGKLALNTEIDEGSTFSLVIPASVNKIGRRHADRHEIAVHTDGAREEVDQPEFSGHVLLAEDVETNQVLAKTLLGQMGLKVTIASDGRQAVREAIAQRFDLILMDIQMPEMNGYEAIEALRKEGIETPIVALTAHALQEDGQKCIDAGCNGYLSKPLDRRRLAEEIRKYLPPRDEVLRKQADSVRSQVDELSALYDDRTAQQFSQEETVTIKDNEEILNWDELVDRLGDEELIKEVVPIFLNDNRDRFDALNNAVKTADAGAIKLYAHAVRGAAKNVGAKRVSNVAYRLECAGTDNDMKIAASLLDELKNELEKIVTFFSRSDWIEIAKQERVIR